MNKFRGSLLMKAFSFCERVSKLVNMYIILNVLRNAIHMV